MSIEAARRFLVDLLRSDLAVLLESATYRTETEEHGFLDIQETVIYLRCHPACKDALDGLAPNDKLRIAEAVIHAFEEHRTLHASAELVRFESGSEITISGRTELIASIVAQRELMISVSTGGPSIDSVNDYYRARRRRILVLLQQHQKADPNPHQDLWAWYHYYRDNYGSYSERRRYCNDMYAGLLDELLASDGPGVTAREPTGWARVDRGRRAARDAIDSAVNEENFQSVGLLCREVLISLGQAVFDPVRHPTVDGVDASQTDAKRMLEAFISFTVPGDTNQEIRRHTKASLALALALQHRRTATAKDAALCMEATESTVNVIAILAERNAGGGG